MMAKEQQKVNQLSSGEQPKEKLITDQEQFDPYATDKLAKIPAYIKIAVLKIWAAGAVCFFIMMASGITAALDLLVIDILTLGLVNEYFINNIIRWMNNDKNPTLHYAFIEKKSHGSLYLNILYSALLTLLIFFTYIGLGNIFEILKIDLIADIDFGSSPIIFGILFFIYDYICVKIKNSLKKKRGK